MRLLLLHLASLFSLVIDAQAKGDDVYDYNDSGRYVDSAAPAPQSQSTNSESMSKLNNSRSREGKPKYQDLSDMLYGSGRTPSKFSNFGGYGRANPTTQSTPTQLAVEQPIVNVSIQLKRVDVVDNGVELEITYRQEWIEPEFRGFLGSEKFRVPKEFTNNYPWNRRSLITPPSHGVSKSFVASLSFASGQFVVEETVILKERCSHNAGGFPSDALTCSSTIDLLKAHKLQEDSEIGLKAAISRPFEIESVQFSKNEKSKDNEWWTLSFEVVIRRHAATYYWFSSVTPTLFFLILTWTSLFLNRERFLTHRLCISLISLFAVIALSIATNSAGRLFEQGNVLDVWFRISSLLIFVVVIVNAVVAILSTWKKEESLESPYSTKQETADVEKLPKAMEYLTKVFYPIIAALVLFYVFIKI